jgi:thiol-disulfide isomerase/thioredoxin
MNHEIVSRLIGAVVIIGMALTAFWLINQFVLARAATKSRHGGLLHPGIPAILYFTTPDCIPCKTIQRPAIDKLKYLFGETLEVVEVDALDRPELASQWGVMSVPTTFIIDASGQPRHVNHGVTTTDKLLIQLKGIVQ